MTGSPDPKDRALAAAPPTTLLRTAGADDVPQLVRLINTAFAIERFFKTGDRTTVEEIRDLRQRGEFLLLEAADASLDAAHDVRPPWPDRGAFGCVYWTRHGEDGYFGMLSIDPVHRVRGLGRLLIDAVE